jgi:glycosyltransferase involved in cell wall biosynthesis
MHIAIDARIINSSTGTYVERLLTYLEIIDQKNQYSVLVKNADRNFWKPTNPNFSIKIADFANYSLNEQTKFKTFLDKLHPDLVHFCMPQQPILYKGKSVTTIHDLTLLKTYNSDKNWLIYHIKQLIGRFVFMSVAKKSKYIITPSKYTKDELTKFSKIDSKKVSVIYESAEPAKISDIEAYKQPYSNYLLYVGQQSDYKNIIRLAEAHQILLKKYPDLGLILVGRINKAAQRNKDIFEKKNYQNILFTGFISNEQRNWLYKNSKAYVFPSLMEGFGLPGLEAMAYGLPVISSRSTCLPEIYGDAAIYFDPYEPSDIANKIDGLLENGSLRDELIKKGYLQLSKYSWKKMAQETLSIYNEAFKD